MRSDVIGDFQEPYGAVLVEGDDMAALPSKRPTPKAARMAARAASGGVNSPGRGGWRHLAVHGRGAALQRKSTEPPSTS